MAHNAAAVQDKLGNPCAADALDNLGDTLDATAPWLPVLQVTSALGKAAKNGLGKVHGHHSDPKFLGGDPKQPLTVMDAAAHKTLHKDMNEFLRTR